MKDYKLWMVAVFIGLCATYFLTKQTDNQKVQQDIANEVLRFHVLANSDSDEDQQLKLKVKEEVVSYLNQYLNEKDLTLEQSKKIVEEKKEEVISLAEQIIRENGYSYSVTAELSNEYFPIKSYGDVTLPAGEYQAFRIKIGESKGKNWWCVLYPPLCFVDASYGYVPDDSKMVLENVLDEECYKTVTDVDRQEEVIEFKFKIFEMIEELF